MDEPLLEPLPLLFPDVLALVPLLAATGCLLPAESGFFSDFSDDFSDEPEESEPFFSAGSAPPSDLEPLPTLALLSARLSVR